LSYIHVILREIIVAFITLKNSLIDRIFYYKDRKKFSKLTRFSENFLNAVLTEYTLHAELNRPAKNRRQQSRAY